MVTTSTVVATIQPPLAVDGHGLDCFTMIPFRTDAEDAEAEEQRDCGLWSKEQVEARNRSMRSQGPQDGQNDRPPTSANVLSLHSSVFLKIEVNAAGRTPMPSRRSRESRRCR